MFLKVLSFLTFIYCVYSQSKEEIDYYVQLITEAQEKALAYNIPRNAREYTITNSKQIDFGTYDFIIIGAGASGTVVANVLSEPLNLKILLLEAGKFGNNLTDIPDAYYSVALSDYGWGYQSIPQKTACLGGQDRICPYPRGRAVGGTTLINGLIYSRGYKTDFDTWASLGNPGWSYDDLLPYFIELEDYHHRDPDAPFELKYHGKSGPSYVEYHLPRSPQLNAFLEANKEIGYDIVDYNANLIGTSPTQLYTKNGVRWDGGNAYVRPILNRPNFKILTESLVLKINICKRTNKTTGVEFSYRNQKYIARARKEVILSAGAIGSAQLLMLSGIGPAGHLKKLKIPIIKNLEVGSRLIDHPCFFGLSVGTNYSEPIRSLEEYVKEYLSGVGPETSPGNHQSVAFYPTSSSSCKDIPDFELVMFAANTSSVLNAKFFQMTNETYQDLFGNINPTNTFRLLLVVMHPASFGTIRLKSNSPYDFPLIDSQFLSDKEGRDIDTMYEAIQMAVRLTETEALKKLDARIQAGPLRACRKHKYLSKNYWYCAMRQVTFNLYHPAGSCKMGPNTDKDAVVDSKLRVHGIENLRVADASIFPTHIAGHPNAICTVIGAKLGDILKAEYK